MHSRSDTVSVINGETGLENCHIFHQE